MVKESRILEVESSADGLDAPPEGQTLFDAPDREPRELWRVVSTDGSTRIFQTKPGAELAAGKRAGTRRALPCALTRAQGSAGPLAHHDAALPTVIAEQESSGSPRADAELSAELTSVTQAWRSLSPGIRGAIMALVRASATARQHRAIGQPRRE